MGLYSGGSSSGGGLYSQRASSGTAPAQPHHPSGFFGAIENLASDIGHAVVGLPAGVVHSVEHPWGSLKAVGHSYAQTYGPLLHGDVSKFLHGLYDHPLGPILDAATLVTGGASLGARAGLLSAERGALLLRSPGALAGQDAKVVSKLTSTNPAIRARQTLVHGALNKLPSEFPVVGEIARYGREVDRLPRQEALRLRNSPEARNYNKAVKNLNNEELAALHLIGRGVHPKDYLTFLQRQAADHGGRVEPTMLKVLENPRINELYVAPDAKLQKAVDAAGNLSRLDAKVKIDRGGLTAENAAARIDKHAQAVYGPEGKGAFYVPDVLVHKRVTNQNFARQGGGVGVPKLPGSMKQNKLTLFKAGQLALHPDLLGPEFLGTLKYGLHDDIHSELMSSAQRVSKEDLQAHGLPRGWALLRKKIVSSAGTPRAETIHPLLSQKGAALRMQEDLVPINEQVYRGFEAQDFNDAQTLHGSYLIVPQQLLKQVSGEFTRSNNVIRNFIERPTRVWRALVLGLRVGFLTNNVIGNHLLYAIHAAGIDGLRAYLNAVKRVKGESVFRSLLSDREIPEALRQRFMDEFFPEQTGAATFGRTQLPDASKFLQGKKGRKLRAATLGVGPATQAAAETNLRRALVETYIRKSPEFKAVYRAMPRQTREFEAAAQKLLKGEGGTEYQRLISDKVNNALGDYLNLGPMMQVARGVVPFVSWYRAITRIVTHLAIDTPGRAEILQKLGQIGDEQNADLPAFLRGLVRIGPETGGRQTVVSTSGVNPFQTVDQLLQGAQGVLTGSPGATGKAFAQLGPNPFLLGMIQNLSGKNLFTGGAIQPGPVPGVLGQTVSSVGQQIPIAQLAAAFAGHGRPSKLYGQQQGLEALLQYLGAPVKHLDVNQARSYGP